MTTQYVVVSGTVARGHSVYGPFPTVEAAHEWASNPMRAPETRDRFEVLPLFGGLVVDDNGAEAWVGLVGDGMAERCYRPGCPNWVTGASDYCSPECEPEPVKRECRFCADGRHAYVGGPCVCCGQQQPEPEPEPALSAGEGWWG